MCCEHSKEALVILKGLFKRRKTMVFWKEIRSSGLAVHGNMEYGPGIFIAKTLYGKPWKGRYRKFYPKGIHVYLDKQDAWPIDNTRTMVEVTCHIDDLIVASATQAVFRKIKITKKQWAKRTY